MKSLIKDLIRAVRRRPSAARLFPCTVDGFTYAAFNERAGTAPVWVAFRYNEPVEAVRSLYGARQLSEREAWGFLKHGRYGVEDKNISVDFLLPAEAVPLIQALPCRARVYRGKTRQTCAAIPTMVRNEGRFLAECTGCGCAAGYGSTEAEALNIWNHWVANPPEAD